MADPFRSANLLFRAVEPGEDDDFFLEIQQDPISYQQANTALAVPQNKKKTAEFVKFLAEEALLGVVICLPPSSPDSKPTPIGQIHLNKAEPGEAVHRHTEIGIDLLKEHQGKGYGSEAIKWALEFAFKRAGLHRVQVRAFEYNPGAMKLYEKLGFQKEGQWKEFIWHDGRFWDDFSYAMLDRDWWAMQKKDSTKDDKAS